MEKEDNNYVLWNLLLLTRDSVHKVRDKELMEYGITTAQSGVLFTIFSLGEQATISKISSQMSRRANSVSIILSRLEKHGLVKKRKPSSWHNPAQYTLTPDGQKAYEYSTKRNSLLEALSVLSNNEKNNLETYLRKITIKVFKDLASDTEPPWL